MIDFEDPDNMENFKQLCNIVYKKMGYGYIMMRGEYREFSGELSQELSLFIPGITKEKLIKLGQQFNQDSVLYKDKKEFVLIGTNSDTGVGNIREKYKAGAGKENISLAKEVLKDFFSSLLKGRHKDKKFAFNKLEEYKELGWMMRMGGYKPFWFNILQEKNEA